MMLHNLPQGAVTVLVLCGALLQLAGTVRYISGTLAGRTRPNRITWLFWCVSPLIGCAASFARGGGSWALVSVFMSGFGPGLVFAASFVNKNAYWQLRRFDYGCGILSLAAMVLWLTLHDPLVAILFAIASDALASVPTLAKAWRHPETERASPFAASIVSGLIGLALTPQWHFASVGFALYLLGVNILLVATIWRTRRV